MKTILVPLDGSSLSEAAIPLARNLASALQAEIVFLIVGPLPETSTQASEEGEDLTQVLSRASRRHSVQARLRVEPFGDPVEGILRAADEEDAQLIVMSTHGRSGLTELSQGSVAREVVRDGRKPVVLVRPRAKPGH